MHSCVCCSLHEIDDRTEIVAKVQIARRLHAGKYQLFCRHLLRSWPSFEGLVSPASGRVALPRSPHARKSSIAWLQLTIPNSSSSVP